MAFVKCINGRFALPTTYLIACLKAVPFVLWTGTWWTVQTPFQKLVFPLTRWMYRHANSIAAEGEHVKRYLVTQGVLAEKIFLAPPAVDNSFYCASVDAQEKAKCKAELSLGGQKVVLYLGRLEEVKGLEYLLKAFATLSGDDVILVLAGDGSLRKGLTELARELGVLQRTRFAGYVSPDDGRRYYAIADLFVLPSVTVTTGKECWGLVVNEAMNQGLPVVATEAVGAAAGGLIRPGVNGLVVPERNPAALAEAIHRILNDNTLREAMSQNARRIIATWNNEQMVRGFQQAIEYALAGSKQGNYSQRSRQAGAALRPSTAESNPSSE